jgi:triacylglycerol lipase
MENNLIIMVSGWGGGESPLRYLSGVSGGNLLWKVMADRFKVNGYDVITAAVPNHGFGDIEDSACRIGIMVTNLRPFYDKIILCGHSMGGLITRAVIQFLEMEDFIDAYISIATPHAGSLLANLAPWSESAKQMRKGSLFLDGLNSMEWPDSVPALALQAQFEKIVIPRSSARIEFGTNKVIKRTDHITIPLSRRAFRVISSWLEDNILYDDGVHIDSGHISRMVI